MNRLPQVDNTVSDNRLDLREKSEHHDQVLEREADFTDEEEEMPIQVRRRTTINHTSTSLRRNDSRCYYYWPQGHLYSSKVSRSPGDDESSSKTIKTMKIMSPELAKSQIVPPTP